jgi:hypothetical protein
MPLKAQEHRIADLPVLRLPRVGASRSPLLERDTRSFADALRQFPQVIFPRVRPYRRAGYQPAMVDDEVADDECKWRSVSDARADNRGISDCQSWRFL